MPRVRQFPFPTSPTWVTVRVPEGFERKLEFGSGEDVGLGVALANVVAVGVGDEPMDPSETVT